MILFFGTVLVGNGQLVPSFGAATGQHLAAVGIFHTGAKAMHGFPAAGMGLIGSFLTWHRVRFFLLNNVVVTQETGHHTGRL